MPKYLGNQDLVRRLDEIAHNVTILKKGNLRCCKNYRTISLISHPCKIMLRIILNRFKGKAEELLSDEKAGFRPKRSTTEQVFNMRLLIEKHIDHHQDLHYNFIDFKKAFDRVWHKGLWRGNTHTDKPGNISDSKIQEYMEQQHQNGNKDMTL